MQRTAELLEQSGFEILRVGRFGVSVRGDEKAFKQELGVSPSRGSSLVETPHPNSEELSRLIDLVEISEKPLNFGES
jgi:hypothetical protein